MTYGDFTNLLRRTTKIKLAEKLHKPITKKSEKRKAYSSFKENIWVDVRYIYC